MMRCEEITTTNWSTGTPARSHRSAFVILIKDRRIIGDIKQIYEGRGTHIKSDQMTYFISIPVYSVREIVKEKTMETFFIYLVLIFKMNVSVTH